MTESQLSVFTGATNEVNEVKNAQERSYTSIDSVHHPSKRKEDLSDPDEEERYEDQIEYTSQTREVILCLHRKQCKANKHETRDYQSLQDDLLIVESDNPSDCETLEDCEER